MILKSGRPLAAVLLALALCGCAASHSTAIFADKAFALGQYRCVVVVPFENQSRTEGAGFAVADFMANALNASERFVVVDRKVVQSLLEDPGTTAYTMDPGRAVEIGRKLNAQAVVIGAVNDYWYRTLDGKPEVSLSMRIVDVEGERVVYVANGSYQPTFFTKRPYLLTAASKDVADELIVPLTQNINLRRLDDFTCGARNAPKMAAAPAPKVYVAPPPPPLAPPKVVFVPPPAPQIVASPLPHKMSDVLGPAIVEPTPPPSPAVAIVTPPPPPAPPALTPGALALLRRMSNSKAFVLEGVDFELDKTSFKSGAYKEALSNLGIAMRNKPALKVRIESHTDGLGDAQFNLKLTDLRAKYLKTYLVTNFQVGAERIETVGYGGERPLLPNINRKNREANRRVELNVVEGP